MELLGDSLEKLMNSIPEKRFSLKTICHLALQMLESIEYIHNNHYIHRDIKPDNFTIGRKQKKKILYIIDFGLSKMYRNPQTLRQNKLVIKKKLTGTARYASIYALQGYEQSRRDDLESIGYSLIYLFNGFLPWEGLVMKTKEEKYSKILSKKYQLFKDKYFLALPENIQSYLRYVRKLMYEQNPNYIYLSDLFKELLAKSEFQIDRKYDWENNENSSSDSDDEIQSDKKDDKNNEINQNKINLISSIYKPNNVSNNQKFYTSSSNIYNSNNTKKAFCSSHFHDTFKYIFINIF